MVIFNRRKNNIGLSLKLKTKAFRSSIIQTRIRDTGNSARIRRLVSRLQVGCVVTLFVG